MKITRILNKENNSISFELFPPKSEEAYRSFADTAGLIAKLKPAFMSVTYGAGGGTSEYTLRLSEYINNELSVPCIAHLTCISSCREDVHRRINDIKNSGIENIMALRGDIPEGVKIPGEYSSASQLIVKIKEIMPLACIGAACYPESHPESRNMDEHISCMKIKVDAGVDFLTSQMFFDNNIFFRYIDLLNKAGINLSVIPGIMPVISKSFVEKSLKLSGAFVPRAMADYISKYENDPESFRKAGLDYAVNQIEGLFDAGIKHVHIYSMNNFGLADELCCNLSDYFKESCHD